MKTAKKIVKNYNVKREKTFQVYESEESIFLQGIFPKSTYRLIIPRKNPAPFLQELTS